VSTSRARVPAEIAALRWAAAAYAAEHDPGDTRVSPLFATLHQLPPLLVQVGDAEPFRDDARLLAARARAAGVAVDLQVWPGMFHVWHQVGRLLPEAQHAVAGGRRIRARGGRRSPIREHHVTANATVSVRSPGPAGT
jgi:acetyl esterase/lipase